MKNFILQRAVDLFFIFLILVAGYLLIGFYIGSSYLGTGYPDWMYHAFRVKSLAENGLLSWDTIWSNGINHWSGYPFGVHYIVLGMTWLFDLSITQAMMVLTVVAFLSLRVFTYIVLRLLHIKPFYAFFATIVSFAFGHQWNAISDFSLFIVMLWIPFYVYVWAKSSENLRYFFITAALTGFLWGVHPVLGYSLSAMFLLLVLLRKHILSKPAQIGIGLLYLAGAAYFIYGQFFTGYSYANPVVSLAQFWKTTVASPYYGLSLLYVILIVIGWGIILLRADYIPRWAKILHMFATSYLIFIWVTLYGYAPGFIGRLQIARAITIIGFLLPFSFGALVQAAFRGTKSRFIPGVLVAVIAIALTNGIELSSQYSGQPMARIENAVAQYFDNRVPLGSIYTDDLSAASYFGNSELRYVNSYNEHRDPHPLGQRYKNLMRTDTAYTGVTQRQVHLVNAYSQVLGVEYIFLPELSPLVGALTSADSGKPYFIIESSVSTNYGIFSVLRATYPIAYAYAGDAATIQTRVRMEALNPPNLYADSYRIWDEEVLRFYDLIQTGELDPLPVSFVKKDVLEVDLRDIQANQSKVIIVQSYDDNWKDRTDSQIELEPTALRFMMANLPDGSAPDRLSLYHEWPLTYWVMQIVGLGSLITAVGLGIFVKNERKEQM
jgi:hypothetical protein